MTGLRRTSAGVFFIAVLWGCCVSPVFALEDFPPLTKEDRVLILAPHPDDEAIGGAGVIQEAVRQNVPVKIVYLTNGDGNELSFIVAEKRIVFKQAGALYFGERRRKEAVDAMALLGLSKKDLIFLGYPDLGTLRIFTQYWGVTYPYKSVLTRVTRVPYNDGYSSGAPYVGESILADIERVLLDFKPTRILVSHPLDNNTDHRAFYLFLKVALWNLHKKIPAPEIYPYLVHEAHWPSPSGFHPELRLEPPLRTQESDIRWTGFDLTADQVGKKKDTISQYRTQIDYKPDYLYSFARKNELFGDYPPITLKDDHEGNIDWQSIEKAQHIDIEAVDEESGREPIFGSLAYARQNGYLYIKLTAQTWNDKLLGVNLHLIGYRRGLPFSYMPKYRLKVSFSKYVTVFEKNRNVYIKDMGVKRHGNNIIIKFPLASLENPHYILSSARSSLRETDVDRTAWRVLVLE